MTGELSEEELKNLYVLEGSRKWLEIVSDRDHKHPYYKIYRDQKNRLLRLANHIKFKRTDDVADFACGNGLLADIISKKVNSYTGVDFSEPFILVAKRRQKTKGSTNTSFYVDDIVKFATENLNKFDKAFALDFTEHIYDRDLIRIFRSIRSTMKDDGRLYIHTPNGDYILEIFKKSGVILKQLEGHIGIRNGTELVRLFKKVGFSSIKISYLPHYLKFFSFFHFLSYIPLIGRYFEARLLIVCVK